MRVVRAGSGLGVVLHAEQRQRAMAQAFQRVVVQVDVRQFDFALLQRIGIDGEVVVVRGDLDLAGRECLHRMVAAVVSELELVGLAAEGEADELMAEADAEDGDFAHHAANVVLRVGHRLGIAGAVGEKHAVRLHRQHIFGAGGRGNHGDAARLAHQATQDVLLDAVVVGDDAVLGRAVFHADDFGRLVGAHTLIPLIDARRGDFLGQVGAVHLGNGARLGDQLVRVELEVRNDAAHHAVGAQVAHECAGVDLGEHGNLVALEVFLGDFLGTPVRADARELADNQALDVRAGGFVVVGVGAVIADLGVGENYDLSSVGRVGENFLIAGDGSIKNDFAVTFAFGAEAFAVEDASVFQRKDCLHRFSGEWILSILSGKTPAYSTRRRENSGGCIQTRNF